MLDFGSSYDQQENGFILPEADDKVQTQAHILTATGLDSWYWHGIMGTQMGTQKGVNITHLSLQEPPTTFEDIKRIYHRELGRKVSQRMAEKARRGEVTGCAPTGYRNVREGSATYVEIDPVLGPLVAEAFRLTGHAGTSLKKVLDELTPRGLVSRNGKPMHPSALRGILTNPFYVGMIRYQNQLIQGRHQALVSPSMFERVQRRLRERRR